jgi:hypothetical protein
MEANADITSIAVLSRRWRWVDLPRSHAAHMDMFDQPADMPCGCYDGE